MSLRSLFACLPVAIFTLAAILFSCASPNRSAKNPRPMGMQPNPFPYGPPRSPVPYPSGSNLSESELWRRVNVRNMMLRMGQGGRDGKPMNPRFITIHSTENYNSGAVIHGQAMANGKFKTTKNPNGGNRIGYFTWHYTVDDQLAVQHLPTNEQGEHADYDGPGNNYSIGIETCMQRGINEPAAVDRVAMLTALLMKRHGIPLSGVVPHYHWPRGSRGQKNCPIILLENGRPGPRWDDFLKLVNHYYRGMMMQG